MEIKRDLSGNIHFYDDNGDIYDVIYKVNDFSKYTNTEYNEFMLNRQHPMCRCSIITMPEEIYFTYATKYLVNEYLEEYNKQDMWIN